MPPTVAAKAPAKGGLKKDRLVGGKSAPAPAPQPPAKKVIGTKPATPAGGPVSGRRSTNPPPPSGLTSARGSTATGARPPLPKPSGKTAGVGINPSVANALKAGAEKKKTAAAGGGGGVKEPSPASTTTTSAGKKPEFLSDSEEEEKKNQTFASLNGTTSMEELPIDTRLVALVEGVRRGWGLIRKQSQVGSPSDAELKKMEDQRKELERTKLNMATDIASWGKNLILDDPEEYQEDFMDFIDRLVMETDARGGNLDLVRTCLEHFTPGIDFAEIISERQWIVNSAADGSMGYMEIFLSVPNVSSTFSMDLPEIVATCCYNQTCRIPMMGLLLKFDAQVIKFAEQECFEDLEDYFNEFWEEVASIKKAIPREDRTGRLDVLGKLVAHPAIGPILKLDGEESGDGMNIFQRAAYEGDVELLKLLLVKHKGTIQDVNQVLGDNVTALIQATMKDHTACVQLLLEQPGIDASIRCPEGTALEIAKLLKRNPLLVAALEKAGEG